MFPNIPMLSGITNRIWSYCALAEEKMKKFNQTIRLSSPTMHGDELKYLTELCGKSAVLAAENNVEAVEKIAAQNSQMKYAVSLSSCTAALHLCIKAVGEKLYGKPNSGYGTLCGKRIFCSDMTFVATVNPVVYEGGIPVFIDSDLETWSMDPASLEKAFTLYPDVKLVVCAELYGFPGRMDLIKQICEKHGAILIEDAAEAMGATVCGKKCGSIGNYSALSYNENKIITGLAGGCLLTNDIEIADMARKRSAQARENALWYQHEDIGYNYRMSSATAGIIRGQYPHLEEHISQKKAIYERYREGLKNLPVKMNPISENTEPNYWLSAMTIDDDYMCVQTRNSLKALYVKEKGKTCPTEILETLAAYNVEGRPFWKPMHLQPLYRENAFVSCSAENAEADVDSDIFRRGLCLPSDNKMTDEEQSIIISIIRSCFM